MEEKIRGTRPDMDGKVTQEGQVRLYRQEVVYSRPHPEFKEVDYYKGMFASWGHPNWLIEFPLKKEPGQRLPFVCAGDVLYTYLLFAKKHDDAVKRFGSEKFEAWCDALYVKMAEFLGTSRIAWAMEDPAKFVQRYAEEGSFEVKPDGWVPQRILDQRGIGMAYNRSIYRDLDRDSLGRNIA